MKKKTASWGNYTNPETGVKVPFPLNRKARRAMRKMFNLDAVPPPTQYPARILDRGKNG